MNLRKNPDEQRNLMLAIGLSLLLLFGYEFWVRSTTPAPEPVEVATEQVETIDDVTELTGEVAADVVHQVTNAIPELPATQRIQLVGKITVEVNTRGGGLSYAETSDSVTELGGDEPVKLMGKNGLASSFDAGWTANGVLTPGPATRWEVLDSSANSVTLGWQNGTGQRFERSYTVSTELPVLNIVETVTNSQTGLIELTPYRQLHRIGRPEKNNNMYVYEGPMGWVSDELVKHKYNKLDKEPLQRTGTGGWWGLTSQYFHAAVVLPEQTPATFEFRATPRPGGNIYSTSVKEVPLELGYGEQATRTYELYLGNKEQQYLTGVTDSLERSQNFGWFRLLADPLHDLMVWVNKYVGNMGWTIVIVTILIRVILFPLSAKSYKAMNQIKKLQPKMEKLKEEYKDNREQLGMAMMRLYKEEKVNPAAGCWPVLLQIPVFFAFYKVILVSYEFRHADFMLWITDLSARDPFFVLPILMGITMWLQMQMNPTPTDETQKLVMKLMPWVFTVMFLFFPSGLVLYWLTSNVCSVGQQWWLMREKK